MLRVLRGEESALMVVEPPGYFGTAAILEIDDGVLVAVKEALIEELRRAVRQSRVHKLGVRVKRPFEETAEVRSRGRSIEAMVVIEDSYPHAVTEAENLPACLKMNQK